MLPSLVDISVCCRLETQQAAPFIRVSLLRSSYINPETMLSQHKPFPKVYFPQKVFEMQFNEFFCDPFHFIIFIVIMLTAILLNRLYIYK